MGWDPYQPPGCDPHTLGCRGNRIQAPYTSSIHDTDGDIEPDIELHRMCHEAFIWYDEVHANNSRQDVLKEVENDEEDHVQDCDSPMVNPKLDEFLGWANTPLYPGS